MGDGELVLVADDEFTIRDITEWNLESFGYRVITANNGADAVAIYAERAEEIALVITDMMMPVMDGAGVVAEVRHINPSARIIVVSGLDVNEDLKRSANGFLAKPYTGPELAQAVHDALNISVAQG
jgi:CheY-like chemotaxis protein